MMRAPLLLLALTLSGTPLQPAVADNDGPTRCSIEARFRVGLIKKITECMTLVPFIDKRSFNFSDHRLRLPRLAV